ncbi:hypothetical protein VC83_02341 [Pseudogymnoascus destructans]|uniref:Tim44-like domain-containing protein n=2 Tax=Pseudogymnoascus destructans TaxID=655981 RepID=L8FRX4_PSED2|nr:uncharacterized protein VC83_02341 [Pseudogymnoascus destructans]ELR03218.1 hypothetical protein GMDG_01201 [Pseudogymnoascus destructans 20631-21]OAF60920.1 hypothetical protein VC83_02341 [Pseudogymnoascus destructans]
MAHLIRRRALGLALQSPFLQTRYFSHGLPRCAFSNRDQAQQPRIPSERSVRIAAKEMSQMTSDFGLLPDTIVAPSSANRPSLLASPNALAKLQWARLKRKAADLVIMTIYRWSNRKHGLKIHFRKTAPTAVALHQQMYTAFAAGNIELLKKITCEGLYDSFASRIHTRPRGERWKWEVIKYTSKPRVMSNRAARLPVDDAGVRQAVVRICSRQRLSRYKADGSLVAGTGEERDVMEYVVIQRMLWEGKENDWMVWGTTEETTLEAIEEAKREALE